MADDAARFRKRARECRKLAAGAKDEDWRRMLLEIATGLEEEADITDAEAEKEA